MVWSDLRPPLPRKELTWIERSMDLLIDHFGRSVVYRPVVTPVAIIPPGFSGSAQDVEDVFTYVCAQLDVPPGRLGLELDFDRKPPQRDGETPGPGKPPLFAQWQPRAERNAINVWMKAMPDSTHMVAALAQEACRELLEGKNHLSYRSGQEPSAELLTVIYGFGIFAGNAAKDFQEVKRRGLFRSGDIESMNEQMYGYALAVYCSLRDEADPAWSAHLDGPVREMMKRGLFYLNARMA
jgi:hypothetical protein